MHDDEEATSPSTSAGNMEQELEPSSSPLGKIRSFFTRNLRSIALTGGTEKVIEDLSFEGLVEYWKQNGFKNVITMVGSDISTSAGVPNIRSPSCTVYNSLQKYDLPRPTSALESEYYFKSPQAFYALAHDFYAEDFKPTIVHYFVRLLHEKGVLLRHYTQNMDGLERAAGIPEEKLVEACGTFQTNHCIQCQKLYSIAWMKERVLGEQVPPICDGCGGVVKPDIIFYDEGLAQRFYQLPDEDFKKCDLLIIIGTSLDEAPFASLVDYALPQCLRLLINPSKVGGGRGRIATFFSGNQGLLLESSHNTRDVAYIGNCNAGVSDLATALDWEGELEELMTAEQDAPLNPTKKAKRNRSKSSGRETRLFPQSWLKTKQDRKETQ